MRPETAMKSHRPTCSFQYFDLHEIRAEQPFSPRILTDNDRHSNSDDPADPRQFKPGLVGWRSNRFQAQTRGNLCPGINGKMPAARKSSSAVQQRVNDPVPIRLMIRCRNLLVSLAFVLEPRIWIVISETSPPGLQARRDFLSAQRADKEFRFRSEARIHILLSLPPEMAVLIFWRSNRFA